jgi:copper homeostasis protein
MTGVRLEVCVDTPDGLQAAIAGGADRIELCSALDLGGLTPTPGLIAAARTAPIPVRAMIRPRAGGFVASALDVEAMLAEIAAVKAAGLEGVVLGVSLRDGRLDADLLGLLIAASAGLGLTLHRVIDRTPDQDAALDTAIALGFDTVLTSGGALTAVAGQAAIARLVARSAGRVTVMAGGGVTPGNAAGLAAATDASWLHASARAARPVDAADVAFGFAKADARDTDADTARAIKAALAG